MAKWRHFLVFGGAMLVLVPGAAHATPDPCFDFVCEDFVCEFDASCSTELNPNIVWKLFWDFGDGESNLGWTVAPTHEYETSCAHLVELELWLWAGGKVEVSCWVIVSDPGPCPGPPIGTTSGRCT